MMAEDSEHTVTCLGTTLLSKRDENGHESDEHAVFCFSPLLISRSDSKKSLNQREDYENSKTPWPVPSIESVFLPEFKVDYGRAGKYFPIREVANGSFGGRVFEATEKFTGQRVALKVIPKSKIISDNAVRQAKEEVEIGRMVGHHSFIIDPPAYWQNRRHLYIVTPWASGGDLYGLLRNYGYLPEELVRIYIAQVAVALEFLHSTGVIYRDLKAENILLNGSDLSIRLSDFGLAKRLKRGGRTKTICGSRVYSAPEIGCSEAGYDHAVDWWSLGVLTHILLIGSLPELDCDAKYGSLSDPVSNGINQNSGIGEHPRPPVSSGNIDVLDNAVGLNEDINSNRIIGEVCERKVKSVWQRSPCNSLAFDLSDEKLSSASRDLIRRLTNFDPSQRPRSLLALSRLAFFVGFDLSQPEGANRVAPRLLVDRLVAKKDQVVEMISSDVVFFETEEELFPVLV
uniref:Putative serine/threonine-protein kinase F31E3.2 n=1 Tax=Lygus hesperus TaxID=30085 RepID=A0A146L0T9_LYGHE